MNDATLPSALSQLSQELVNPRSLRDLRTLHLLTRRLERGMLAEVTGLVDVSDAELAGWLLMISHMIEQDPGMRERMRQQGQEFMELIAGDLPYRKP